MIKWKCSVCADTGVIKLAPPSFDERQVCPNVNCEVRHRILAYLEENNNDRDKRQERVATDR